MSRDKDMHMILFAHFAFGNLKPLFSGNLLDHFFEIRFYLRC